MIAHARSDQRGTILVLGIMLGAFMVGALAYLAGVGEALVFRETAQDAADTSAYEAALWNARGMNVLVALNMFIAIVMAVLVAWRIALFFVGALMVLAAVGCLASFAFPVLAPACQATYWVGRVFQNMAKQDPKIQKRVYQVIGALHDGQRVLASAAPMIGIARSNLSTRERYGMSNGVGMGPILLPAQLLNRWTGAPALPRPRRGDRNGATQPAQCRVRPPPDRNGRRPRIPGALLGVPVSLPFQSSDDLDTLCGNAGRMQVELGIATLALATGGSGDGAAGPALAQTGQPGSVWAKIFEYATRGMSGALCGDFTRELQGLIEDQITATCSNPDVLLEKDYGAMADIGETAEDVCERLLIDEIDRNQSAGGDFRGTQPEPAEYAELWAPLVNGAVFAQSWGIVRVDVEHPEVDRMLGLAGQFGPAPQPVAGGSGSGERLFVFAQAEMFFDCEGDFAGCAPNAAWQMNWRARLRRVHSPLATAAGSLEQRAVGQLASVLDQDFAARIPGISEVAILLRSSPEQLLPRAVRDATEDARRRVGDQGNSAAAQAAQQVRELDPFIH